MTLTRDLSNTARGWGISSLAQPLPCREDQLPTREESLLPLLQGRTLGSEEAPLALDFCQYGVNLGRLPGSLSIWGDLGSRRCTSHPSPCSSAPLRGRKPFLGLLPRHHPPQPGLGPVLTGSLEEAEGTASPEAGGVQGSTTAPTALGRTHGGWTPGSPSGGLHGSPC